MGKSKLGRLIFRKIKGRIIPIKITNKKVPELSTPFVRERYIDAFAEGRLAGRLKLSVPKRGKSATLGDVNVYKEYRRKGISRNLFKRATDFLSKAKFKYLQSADLQNVAQVKIRAKYGKYKAGFKKKSRTKFFADQFGPYGEETRRITSKEAMRIIKENKSPASRGRLVTATTKLKKYLRKKR